MKSLSVYLAALLIAVFAQNALAETPVLPVVEIMGKEYYVYTSRKNDNLYAIAHDYGWDHNKLLKLNPNAVSPLKKGIKIYYPVKDTEAVQTPTESLSEQDSEPVVHVVKRGETVYGIANMYSIPVDRIYLLNPESRDGIKAGARLILKEKELSIDDDANPRYYTVKRGDTLYQLARKFSTSVASILKLNPGVSEQNFKAGEVIRLPEKGQGVRITTQKVEEERLGSFDSYKVDKKDTWETIARKTGVDKEDLIEANKEMGDKPKNKAVITVPRTETVEVDRTVVEEDPRELSPDGVGEIYDDVHKLGSIDSLGTVKVAILMSEPSGRMDLEYVRGFLTGVDRLKHKDFKIKLDIIDGTGASSDILSRLSDLDPDIMFLTNERNIPDFIGEYAEISQTPVVNTFDVRSESYLKNPYIVQLLTPSNYFNDEIAANLAAQYKDATLIFVGPADNNDALAQALSDIWPKNKIRKVSVGGLANASFTDFNNYLLYGYPQGKDAVEELLTNVISAKEKYPLASLTILGRPNWIVYEESMKGKFHEADLLIPSRFYYDESAPQSKSFVNYYQSLFDRQPAKSYPMYAGMGYDTSLFFIPAMKKAEGDINLLGESEKGVQSEFLMRRPTNWSGFINPVVYLVRFSPGNTVEKMLLK